MREKDKEYQRRNVQPLVVMAQQPFQLKRPRVYVKVNEAAWSDWTGESGWPDSVPASVLFDPLSTVSATYGVALQTKFRDDNNVWSSEPAIFVIDAEGVVRHLESHSGEDIREDRIFPIVDNLQQQRLLIAALQAKKGARGEAARIAVAPFGARTKTAIPALSEALKDEAAQIRAGAAAALYWIAPEAATAVPHSAQRFRIATTPFAGSAAWRSRGSVQAPGRRCRHSSRFSRTRTGVSAAQPSPRWAGSVRTQLPYCWKRSRRTRPPASARQPPPRCRRFLTGLPPPSPR